MTDTPPVSVQTAIARIMADLPAIGKDGKAAASQGGYAYRGIEQITRHLQPLLAKHGVTIVPQVRSVDVKDIIVAGKPWTDTTLVVAYLIVGPDGSTLDACTVGIGRDNSDKGANKAMTQALKYLILQLFCVSDAKDDTDGQTHEADAHHHEPPASPLVKRARAVFDRLKTLDDDQKEGMRQFAIAEGGQALSVASMVADADWLGRVETALHDVAGVS